MSGSVWVICKWSKDKTLESIVGYTMTCLPGGATRVVSANLTGYRFCPYCGKPLCIEADTTTTPRLLDFTFTVTPIDWYYRNRIDPDDPEGSETC